MKINQVGITEMGLSEGAIAVISKNELQLHLAMRIEKIALPGEPKWTRTESGKMFRLPSARIRGKLVSLETYELAVNTIIPGNEIQDVMRKLGKKGKKEVRGAILDMARFSLLFADQKQDREMMKKCTWLIKVYRSFPMVLSADGNGNYGAVACQQLFVIGG